ncbi:MAG: DNA/RNA helicase domain-containing protein [Cyanobacteria bacterium P01_C01_bin.120]
MAPQQLDVFAANLPKSNCGWLGTVADFLLLSTETWLAQMISQHQRLYQQQPAKTQVQAWQDTAAVLSRSLQLPHQQAWMLVFEYELPREGGRRPDVVLMAGEQIWVLEFKQKSAIAAADLDQSAAYARDLKIYHPGCRDRRVMPLLVLTRRELPAERREDALPVNPAQLQELLATDTPTDCKIDAESWIAADYAPLPTVIQAARQIFQREPLPSIRRAASAGIPQLLANLNQLVVQASQQQERHLVLITGVPGAGKTLVGLQFVYQNPLAISDRPQAVFLSGNGPLIQVLQYALKNRVFVQPVRNFYLQHQVRRQSAPPEHIIVFDEAQRAWDAGRMTEKYGIDQAAGGTVLRIAERIPDWAVVVALIGEGQEIHVGEEEDIGQWQVGLQQSEQSWYVHCPQRYEDVFTEVSHNLNADAQFDLTTSLRTHQAATVQEWINQLLSGSSAAAALMPKLWESGFRAYLTRDLDVAKQYCRDRYGDQPDKRYGMVASSRAKNLTAHGVANDYKSTLRVNAGPWYIDPPNSPRSCCALEQVVTEFGCQGLELDMAIVAWGNDLLWQDQTWICTTRQRNVRDPRRLRLNSYRVLLSRGRDGFVVFIPPESPMDETAARLLAAGLVQLPDSISTERGAPDFEF